MRCKVVEFNGCRLRTFLALGRSGVGWRAKDGPRLGNLAVSGSRREIGMVGSWVWEGGGMG